MCANRNFLTALAVVAAWIASRLQKNLAPMSPISALVRRIFEPKESAKTTHTKTKKS